MNSKILSCVGITIFLLVVSCGEDTIPESPKVPTEWIGQDGDFQKEFNLQSEGNETILIHKESTLPFAGKVERNGTNLNTTQTFENGKLNGVSIKKSKDGSWVEAHYRNGKLDGDMIFYSKNGKKRSVLNYANGVLQK
ncbi:MAG: hypothetical protein HN548_13005 [Opitutae bacterium]|nr:hypothetical protein [Opitutae bacterium]